MQCFSFSHPLCSLLSTNRKENLFLEFEWQQINEKPQIIQEYESGKAIPNNQIIAKLERVLGVKLRGGKK
jgi:hypothetical protein